MRYVKKKRLEKYKIRHEKRLRRYGGVGSVGGKERLRKSVEDKAKRVGGIRKG